MLRHILVKGDHDPTLRQREEIAFVPAQTVMCTYAFSIHRLGLYHQRAAATSNQRITCALACGRSRSLLSVFSKIALGPGWHQVTVGWGCTFKRVCNDKSHRVRPAEFSTGNDAWSPGVRFPALWVPGWKKQFLLSLPTSLGRGKEQLRSSVQNVSICFLSQAYCIWWVKVLPPPIMKM